jgi:predicted lipid-binding transport protein (Tim44 family)
MTSEYGPERRRSVVPPQHLPLDPDSGSAFPFAEHVEETRRIPHPGRQHGRSHPVEAPPAAVAPRAEPPAAAEPSRDPAPRRVSRTLGTVGIAGASMLGGLGLAAFLMYDPAVAPTVSATTTVYIAALASRQAVREHQESHRAVKERGERHSAADPHEGGP